MTDQPRKTTMQERKKSRASIEYPIDHLSDLPDSLIHRILSLMDIKNAVQTCILSKRWKNLWTTLLELNFDSESFHNLPSFKKFVLNVFSRRGANCLLRLRLCHTSVDWSFIRRVLQHAVWSNVKEVSLLDQSLHIAHFLFSCKSLRTLKLQNCKLVESHFFDSLSMCVNLEDLTMIGCYVDCGKTIKFSGPRLVKLTLAGLIKNILPCNKYELVLSAPRLSVFFYDGQYPLALSMDGCPVLQKMGILLQVSSRNLQRVLLTYEKSVARS